MLPVILLLSSLAQQPGAASAGGNTTSGLVSLSLSAPLYSTAQTFTLLIKPICESDPPTPTPAPVFGCVLAHLATPAYD